MVAVLKNTSLKLGNLYISFRKYKEPIPSDEYFSLRRLGLNRYAIDVTSHWSLLMEVYV